MSEIILFGAGVYAKKYKALLEYLHIEFDYFTDNDISKWGTMIYGKPVIAPDDLIAFGECRIIISSTHEIAIRKQLSEMGMSNRIIGLEDLYKLCEQQMNVIEKNIVAQNEDNIIVDMYEGIGWGGSELWAANLAFGLRKAGKKVVLLGGTEQPELEKQYEILARRISDQETIAQMVNLFEANLPCVLINNFAGCAFMAAVIVKKKYPDWVRIISVIHNDNTSLFNAHMILAKYIDKIFCVSKQIYNHMQELYSFDCNGYFFREQPMAVESNWTREWNMDRPIRIGYAARLVKQQKRADLLVDLISHMENANMNYRLQIAGEGECEIVIKEYVVKNKLEDKIQLLGRLFKTEMDQFWKNQDIFINISEYEGASLSMLEAMAHGCVPIVTDVSGVREFIREGYNGYICEVGNFSELVEDIQQLAGDRERLRIYGSECRKIIKEKCNPDKYIEFWIEEILE